VSPYYCRTTIVGVVETSSSPFLSTGVSTTGTTEFPTMFAATAVGQLWAVTDAGASPPGFDEALPFSLPPLFSNPPSLTSISGFKSAGATMFNTTTVSDVLIIPSLDGHLYGISQLFCGIGSTRGGVGSSIVGPTGCAQWLWSPLPVTPPGAFAGPPRVSITLGLVFVTTTDPNLAMGGTLMALDNTAFVAGAAPGTGTVWSTPAKFNGNLYPLVEVVPAFSPLTLLPETELIIPFGPAIVVLDARTGRLLASVSVGEGGACPSVASELIVSSVAVGPVVNGTTVLYAITTSGFLWGFDMVGSNLSVGLSCRFACKYTPITGQCGPVVTAPPEEEAVHGGFYKRTTRAERDELHTALRVAHTARHGAAATAQVHLALGVGVGIVNGVLITDPSLEAAAIAAELSPAEIASLHLPSGYRAPLGGIAGSTYELSTPAVSPDGLHVAFTTFKDGGIAPNGMVVANAADGTLASADWLVTLFGYDDTGAPLEYASSRSSPTWDTSNHIYVAFDLRVGATTTPTLAVLTLGPDRPVPQWGLQLGYGGNVSFGSASPVLVDALAPNSHTLFIAGPQGTMHMVTGCPSACPSSSVLLECSGHGVCDGTLGSCTCQTAWSGDRSKCDVFSGCGNGVANNATGTCTCNGCWTKDAAGVCSIPYDCLNGGQCEALILNNITSSSQTCACGGGCWDVGDSGQCTLPFNCGPNGTCVVDTCVCDNCFAPNQFGFCTPKDCGLTGVCDAGSGACDCDPCFSIDISTGECSTVEKDCGAGGECNGADGTCVCESCFALDAFGLCTLPKQCGPGGLCSPVDGSCGSNGDACYSLDPRTGQWDVLQTCSGHGECAAASGLCSCDAGFDNISLPNPCEFCDACHIGSTCASPYSCGGHGACALAGNAGARKCTCGGGWTGTDCTIAPPPQAAASGPDNVPVVAGASTAVVLLLAVGGFLYRRRGGYTMLTPGPARYAAGSTKSAPSSAPSTFSSISKSAGFSSAGAAAAGERLAKLTGTPKPQASDTSALLGARTDAKAMRSPFAKSGGYGGL